MTVIAAAADGRGSKGNVVARHSGSSITKQCAATRIHCTDNDIIPSLTGVSHFVAGMAQAGPLRGLLHTGLSRDMCDCCDTEINVRDMA